MAIDYAEQRRQQVIADLVSQAVGDGHIELADVGDGLVRLRLTEAGHRHLDDYFAERYWKAEMSDVTNGEVPTS